jgi:hypothetical protein
VTQTRPLDVTDLGLECEADGTSLVKVWCKCRTADDIDDVIAWLHLAKTLTTKWRIIRMGKHHVTEAAAVARRP